jgi:hypothetical protein
LETCETWERALHSFEVPWELGYKITRWKVITQLRRFTKLL